MSERLELRPSVNVPDALARDSLVRRAREIRAEAVQSKSDLEYWNRTHPDERPFDTGFEDQVIAWCDGQGPLPEVPA